MLEPALRPAPPPKPVGVAPSEGNDVEFPNAEDPSPGNALLAAGAFPVLNMEARKGFAAPANPVACGRNPTPVVSPEENGVEVLPTLPLVPKPPLRPLAGLGFVPKALVLALGDSLGD